MSNHFLYFKFKEIYIEKNYRSHKNVLKILNNLKMDNKIQIHYIDDVYDHINKSISDFNPEKKSKKLLLGGIRGKILKKCPGSQGHICCNYYVINLYLGCPINCTYCILQAYLNQPFTIINVNLDIIFDELSATFNNNRDKIFRVGTGELGDSLAYDHITGFSKDFISFFSNHKNSIFEFKTKTVNIDNLISCESPGNIVVGFSVNPQIIVDREEGYATCIYDRLEAAKNLTLKNYKISLHFDPVINIINFDKEYSELIKLIFSKISPKDIAWISLGTFRYTKKLKNKIEENYPNSKILYEEFIECADGKYRYFKPVRQNIYNKLIKWLTDIDKNMIIYFCMESHNIWENSISHNPYKDDKIKHLFSMK